MKNLFSFGNICLFVVALALTFGTALIVNICGGDKLSCVMSSVFAGILGTMLIGGVAEACNWKLTEGPEAGIIATLVGLVIVVLFF